MMIGRKFILKHLSLFIIMNKKILALLPSFFFLASCISPGLSNIRIEGLTLGMNQGAILELTKGDGQMTCLFTNETGEDQELSILNIPKKLSFSSLPDEIKAVKEYSPAGPVSLLEFFKEKHLMAVITDRGNSRLNLGKGSTLIPGDPVKEGALKGIKIAAGRKAVHLILENPKGNRRNIMLGDVITLSEGDEEWKLIFLLATVPDQDQQNLTNIAYEGLPLEVDWVAFKIK